MSRFTLWYLTPLSTIFQLDRGNELYLLKTLKYPEITTDLSQFTNELYRKNGIRNKQVQYLWALISQVDMQLPYDQGNDGPATWSEQLA